MFTVLELEIKYWGKGGGDYLPLASTHIVLQLVFKSHFHTDSFSMRPKEMVGFHTSRLQMHIYMSIAARV